MSAPDPAPSGASLSTADVATATHHVRHRAELVERARRLAGYMPAVSDAAGRSRLPTPAEVVRRAAERGLAVLERELVGVGT